MTIKRSFETIAKERQVQFRETSPTISNQGRSPLDDKGRRHKHLLALGHEEENLYPALRGRDGACNFFKERGLKWWNSGTSGDCSHGERPTRNMASSQVACVNFLLPLAVIPGALVAMVRAIDTDVSDIVSIYHEGNVSPVEFEWIGLDHSLEGGTTRGANNTSVDAFVIASTRTGLRQAYLMEWKYVEKYPYPENKGEGSAGKTRRQRYSTRYSAGSSSFNSTAPMDELFYEPFYQIMRLRLLADRMVKQRELDVSEAKVVVVVPKGNKPYREVVPSLPLAKRFPTLKAVEDVIRATLKRPDDTFSLVCPSTLVDAVRRECGGAVASWAAYQQERYG